MIKPFYTTIPSSWAVAELGSLVNKIIGGGTPSRSNNAYYQGDIPWMTVKDMTSRRPGKISEHITLEAVANSSTNLIPPHTIIIATRMSLGKIVMLPFEVAINQDLKALIIPEYIDKNYVEHWFISRSGYLESLGTGTTVKGIRLEVLKRLRFPLPPLNEQKRIVTKIEALQTRSTAVKEELEAIKPLLDQFRQSVLAAAFRGDLTKDWREQNPDVEPAEVLLERIRIERCRRWEEAELEKMKAKGKAPKDDKWKKKYKEPEYSSEVFSSRKLFPIDNLNWTVAHLELLVNPIRGIPYGIIKTGEHTIDGIPTVRCGDIKNYGIDINKLKLVSPEISCNYNRTLLEGNEVLLSIRGTVGSVALATSEMKNMNISREIAMIPTLPDLNRTYAMYLLSSPIGFTILAKHTKGVAHSGKLLNDLRSFPVPIAPLEEQKEIVRRIESLFKLADSIEQQYQQAEVDLETLNREQVKYVRTKIL